MTKREIIRQLRSEMAERQAALKAEIAAWEEVKRASLRRVASTLPVVPPALQEYLAAPNPFAAPVRSGAVIGMDDGGEEMDDGA